MGQALSSCAPCCSGSAKECEDQKAMESYDKAVREFYQKSKNPHQCLDCGFEKIETNDEKIVLAVDPKFTEQEIAAERTKVLMNLKSCFDESAAEFQH